MQAGNRHVQRKLDEQRDRKQRAEERLRAKLPTLLEQSQAQQVRGAQRGELGLVGWGAGREQLRLVAKVGIVRI